jgi:hypothetical protein
MPSPGRALLACLWQCILGCIERLMEIFNRYTMVYVSLYGNDFYTSGKRFMKNP